ncbi:wound-induced protein 1-like isoform 1 [Hibiscus syriacus]|uniref:Wound-induced protein 1-like isoform 1 n=1 Tax=Hibiscus syriacus TaxID=106335 RepID=A0A6A3BHB7_HIBSY|nr:uncharacterized protein LOC120217454 [Hibiscus syriacus]KAE8714848.1 wound-induced protein 1-like isoform 1 [Hibiscus syriacus]
MGKSVVCTTKGQDFARAIPSDKLHRPKHVKPISRNRVSCREKARPSGVRVNSERVKQKTMDDQDRVPLAQVVSELVKGWFQDALNEAKAGDTNMQILVGQMYCNGYGVAKDVQKGRAWIDKASRNRSSVWKVSDKRPGYNASDSDSDAE